MRTLVIGGTQFIGRHVVEALVQRGDEVTLFHRGKTNPDLFPEVTHIFGDRNDDLQGLGAGTWDATIDTCAYYPRQVRRLADALGGRGGTYVYISSVSAYAGPFQPGYAEDTPLASLDNPTVEQVTDLTYGGLKVLCEQEAVACFTSAPVLIVRPTYVVGPFDPTERFTWWVERVAEGGTMVVPGPRDNPFQVIDVRDLASFLVTLTRSQASETFHTVGPSQPITFEEFLATLRETISGEATFQWADPALLREYGVKDSAFPLWGGDDPAERYVAAASPAKAIAAGLVLRPLSDTIEATLAYARAHAERSRPSSVWGLSGDQARALRARIEAHE